MKLKEEEISDLVYLGRRLDKVLAYLIKTDSSLKQSFLDYTNNYFIPIIDGNITQEEEDYFFDEMNSTVDELEEIHSQTFENKLS
jgi:hypothetical protein